MRVRARAVRGRREVLDGEGSQGDAAQRRVRLGERRARVQRAVGRLPVGRVGSWRRAGRLAALERRPPAAQVRRVLARDDRGVKRDAQVVHAVHKRVQIRADVRLEEVGRVDGVAQVLVPRLVHPEMKSRYARPVLLQEGVERDVCE